MTEETPVLAPTPVPPLPSSPIDETVSFAGFSNHVYHISRKLLSNFKGSWFDQHFGQSGPITYPRWTTMDKQTRPIYHVDVPDNVLEAFIHLHAMPELFPIYTLRLPDCCSYGIQLDTWLRYMAQYFSNQTESLKRPFPEKEVEPEPTADPWKRDTSRPPKRFKRDVKEWEKAQAFLKWVFDNHPLAKAFLNCDFEELEVVMPRNQTFPMDGVGDIPVLEEIFGKDKKADRYKQQFKRIILNHYNVSLELGKCVSDISASNLFNYPNNVSRDNIWPVNGKERLSIDDRFMLITFKWADWDGSSV
jgi:hypothetical protein